MKRRWSSEPKRFRVGSVPVRAVDADANALSSRLAGTFSPTAELYTAAERAHELNARLLSRTKASK